MTQEEIAKLTDRELHQRCQMCGANIRKLQKEFAGYLPEVEKRRLFLKKGFRSLYDYARMLAGMSSMTVDEILRVHKKLSDKPILKELITEQGWGKLKVVASVAKPETQEFWSEKVKQMSCATLQTFVKELKKDQPVDA